MKLANLDKINKHKAGIRPSPPQNTAIRNPTQSQKGLGDLVEKVAQPIARVIDKVFKTNVQGCSSCQKRKDDWNKRFPLN